MKVHGTVLFVSDLTSASNHAESGLLHSVVIDIAVELHAGLIVISNSTSSSGTASGAALVERVARQAP
jgi:hypothetical protein